MGVSSYVFACLCWGYAMSLPEFVSVFVCPSLYEFARVLVCCKRARACVCR